MGLDAQLGERGQGLSQGQLQRLSIARALLSPAPILLLDEATSALDSVTEAKIQRAFDNLSVGRTTLIIAHRLSTIRSADRIVSIADGIITECGSHAELLEKDGIYAELISDSMGIHVDPYMQRLVRKIKTDDRIILISDAYASDGPVPPGYEGVEDINFDHSGEIAGSRLSLDIACRNMMVHTGASIVDVFRYASYNPSRAVGLTDRGEIREGLRADLVICDHQMNIKSVILKGEFQK